MSKFEDPFTYNLLRKGILILTLSFISINSLLIILMLSFFSAAYSLILYSSTNQGQIPNRNLSLISIAESEILILFSHI